MLAMYEKWMRSPVSDGTRVILFAKAPRPGLVKTRLAVSVGEAQATKVYRDLVEDQLRRIPPDWAVEIRYTPDDAAGEVGSWLGRLFRSRPQGPGELGERLARASGEAFLLGAERVMLIGGDCPGLDRATFYEARSALVKADVTLGPTADGGYYLIGMRRHQPRLFTGIPWSTRDVLSETLKRAAAERLAVALLPEKEDVDDWESLQRTGWSRSVGSCGGGDSR
jgi:uncharacterized protein